MLARRRYMCTWLCLLQHEASQHWRQFCRTASQSYLLVCAARRVSAQEGSSCGRQAAGCCWRQIRCCPTIQRPSDASCQFCKGHSPAHRPTCAARRQPCQTPRPISGSRCGSHSSAASAALPVSCAAKTACIWRRNGNWRAGNRCAGPHKRRSRPDSRSCSSINPDAGREPTLQREPPCRGWPGPAAV